MSYRYSVEAETGSRIDRQSAGQNIVDNGKDKGFTDIQQGQIVTGTVVSVDDQVTLDFDGQEVTTSSSALKDVAPGDVKNFEVVKATSSEIELKLLEDKSSLVKTILAVRVKDADWDTLMDRKEQTLQKTEQEAEYQEVKNKLAQISTTYTEADLRLLEEEGFPIESYTVEGLAEALDRVKTVSDRESANIAHPIAGNSQNPVYDRLKENSENPITQLSNSTDKQVLAKRLQEEKLPVTGENLSRLSQALNLSDLVSNIDDKTMRYLISTASEPTAADIYKAYFSKDSRSAADMGTLSEAAWKELGNQVKTVITEAGYEVTEQNLSDAKWLIENKLPLTAETYTYKKDLEAIKANPDKEEILKKMLTGMKKGIDPKEVSLRSEQNTTKEQLISKISSISDEAIAQAVQKDCELTIKNLAEIQDRITAATPKSGSKVKAAEAGNNGKVSEAGDKVKAAEAGDKAAVTTGLSDGAATGPNDRAAAYVMKSAVEIENCITSIAKKAAEVFDTASDINKALHHKPSDGKMSPEDMEKTVKEIKNTASAITKLTEDIRNKASNITQEVANITAETDKAGKSEKSEEIGAVITKESEATASTDKNIADKVFRTGIPYTASDIIKKATEITKCSVELAHAASDITQSVAATEKAETDIENPALNITKAAVDITREISDITKTAMKLIDVTQDIEKPVTNLVQTPADNSVKEESLSRDTQDGQDKGENSSADSTDYQYEELKAKRQLEEIRLKMNLEAAGRLEKQGISVETEKLSKVVDALREQEDDYYKRLLKEADAPASEEAVELLKETTQGIEKLKYMPCSVLGSTLSERLDQTITGLVTEGSKLQSEYTKAGTAYETLATVPNSEYGDSLKKAFANADSLLNQLGLESTEQNRRAIRILGYNQMEVTEESVNQVKAYDKQVTDLIQNLHPAVAVRMIKEGIDPLNVPVNELNHTIDRMKEEQGITSEDKYSTYLRNLEKQEGITSEERKAYIGIYRLLYNVEKSDGAVVGAVVKTQRDVTLGNLLTAIQTNKKGSLNARIDDEFGTLQSITHKGETITEQLSSLTGDQRHKTSDQRASQQNASDQSGQGFNRTSGQPDSRLGMPEALTAELNIAEGQPQNVAVKEQTEYLNRILKQIKEELTPEKLTAAGSSISLDAASQRQSTADTDNTTSSQGIWEKLKAVPVEKLFEQLQSKDEVQKANLDTYTAKVQELRELSKNAEQSIRFLNDYRMPATPLNIMMTNQLLSNGESPIRKLIKLKNENEVEKSENDLKEMKDLSDTLVDKNSMQEAYEALEADAKQVLNTACSEEIIDSKRLAELKSMSQQMTFTRTLAEKEFYQIPIETDKGITNMNLTIIRGAGNSGKVSVNVQSEQLGNVKAEFVLKEQVLKGYISSDDSNGLRQLQQNTGIMDAAAQDCNVTIKQMDFGLQQRGTDSYNYQHSDKEGAIAKGDTERSLYRIAKAVVQTVRMAENSTNELSRAVS